MKNSKPDWLDIDSLNARAQELTTIAHMHGEDVARSVARGASLEGGFYMPGEHPLVYTHDGPAGPRPRLVGNTGLDVWEVVLTVRHNENDLLETAEYLQIPLELVKAAVAYYQDHAHEIDEWIRINEAMSRMAAESREARREMHAEVDEDKRL
jgi:uncharacterized protein (DUF433 family)